MGPDRNPLAESPGKRGRPARIVRTYLDSYIDRIAERHIREFGRAVRNRATLRRWMAAYAAETASQ
ncbi:MAG: hypothetical protein OXI97_01130 [Acidimicrobiaceae bacterium]|nr:hypothetical protein [Acidimicrobiaceae bacterium]